MFVLRLVQGALIGAGAILPGVSGGMLCLLFGVYEPMMALLSQPFKAFREHRRLFLPLMLGGLAGFFGLARAAEWAFAQDASAATCLFLGLVAGSLPPLAQDAGSSHRRFFTGSLALMLALMALARNLSLSVQPNALTYLLGGAVWGLSLVLPGLSSSTLLIFLGLYQPITAGIAALDPACILPLGTGIVLTVLLTARWVSRLLETHRDALLNAILGAVCASALMILPLNYQGWLHGLFCLLCAVWGFGCALLLETVGQG